MTSQDRYNRFPTESDDMFNCMVESNYDKPKFMTDNDDLNLSKFRTHNNIPEPKSKTKNTSYGLSVKTYKHFKCTEPLDSDSETCSYE